MNSERAWNGLAIFLVGCIIAVIVLLVEGDQSTLAVIGGSLIGFGAGTVIFECLEHGSIEGGDYDYDL